MSVDLAIVVLLIAACSLVARRLDRLSVGPALAFVAIGSFLSDDVLGPISLEPEVEAIKVGPLESVVAWTVLLSVVLHGLRAGPLAARYGRHMAAPGPSAPELGDPAASPATRLSWAGERPRPNA
jgi:hypothetical protein